MAQVRRIPKFLALATILAVTAAPMMARADDKDMIEYRQHLMKALDAQTSALGMTLSGAIPDDQLVSHLEVIALLASNVPGSFEPKVLGGDASPEIWEKWADFSERMNAFAANTAKVAQMAKEQGKDAIMGELTGALTCKPCHDAYRTKN